MFINCYFHNVSKDKKPSVISSSNGSFTSGFLLVMILFPYWHVFLHMLLVSLFCNLDGFFPDVRSELGCFNHSSCTLFPDSNLFQASSLPPCIFAFTLSEDPCNVVTICAAFASVTETVVYNFF